MSHISKQDKQQLCIVGVFYTIFFVVALTAFFFPEIKQYFTLSLFGYIVTPFIVVGLLLFFYSLFNNADAKYHRETYGNDLDWVAISILTIGVVCILWIAGFGIYEVFVK